MSTSKQLELKVTLTTLFTERKHLQDNDSQQTQPSTSQFHLQSHVTALDILVDEDDGSDNESDPILDEVESFLQEKSLNKAEFPLTW